MGEFVNSTALFFGSFNPIHNGHISIAKYLLDNGLCSELWFVVSPHNPLKNNNILADEDVRLSIVKCAVSDNLRMKACDIEFFMPRPSYTVDTLKKLNGMYPDRQFALVIGEDNLLCFNRWRDYKYILSNFKVFVYPRTCSTSLQSNGESLSKREIPMVLGAYSENIVFFNAPLCDVSSTEIREILTKSGDISSLVPLKCMSDIIRYYSK